MSQQTLDRLAARGIDIANLDPKILREAAKRARRLRASLARQDPNMFCQFVLRDERDGKPIQQAPMHERWQKLFSDYDRLLIWSHVEGGKTNQIAIGRALFELGKDPSLRVAIISNTNDLAKKITRQLGQYIEKSKELHEVFPHLIPTDDPSLPWKSQALTVMRTGMGSKDPSIQAAGMHGNIIGSRIDLLILDDVLDFENTNTPAPREDAYRWLKYIMGRLTEHGRVCAIGNAWHPEDAMHRLEKDGFKAVRFPVILPDGTLTWPSRWSRKRIDRAAGPGGLGPLEFARQLMCQARDDTSARFQRGWIDQCVVEGDGFHMLKNVEDLMQEQMATEEEMTGFRATASAAGASILAPGTDAAKEFGAVVTGVDLAVQAKDSSDETVLFTILVLPDGRRRVLSVRAGKWTGPEIIKAIENCYRDFGGLFVVENNAAQAYIGQFLGSRASNVPVVPFTTGRQKAHPEYGVESLATELAGKRWIIPSRDGVAMDKQVAAWVTELLFYDPKEHTGDRVMASWFAREGARMFVDRYAGGGGQISARVF